MKSISLTNTAVAERTLHEIPQGGLPSHPKLRKLPPFALGLVLATPLAAGIATAADVATANGGTSNNAPILTKPAWLPDLSISVKESFDDNVFVSGTDPAKYPAGTALNRVPSNIAIAYENKPAFITTVSPKVGLNFVPLLGEQSVLQALSLAYSPDFVDFHGRPSESYDAHRIAAAIKGKAGDVTFAIENGFNAIDGDKYGPLFPGGLNSAYSTGVLRERRSQYQDRNAVTIQYDQDKFFVRPTSSLLYYDLRTVQLTRAQAGGQAGYQNYADRYDVNGGLDLGYKITPQFAATVGYRYGSQYQEKYSKAIDPLGLSSSSDYQRVLFGVEGKPFKWLDAKLQIGPDFRNYGESAPVSDRDLVTYYGEASLTGTISSKDSVSFKYKQFQWVSSTGRAPYFDSVYELGYKRKLTSQLALELGGRFGESDYTSGLDPAKLPAQRVPNPRDDSQTTLLAGLTYTFNQNVSLNLAYSLDLGRNLQKGITNDSTREFERDLVSLGANFKF